MRDARSHTEPSAHSGWLQSQRESPGRSDVDLRVGFGTDTLTTRPIRCAEPGTSLGHPVAVVLLLLVVVGRHGGRLVGRGELALHRLTARRRLPACGLRGAREARRLCVADLDELLPQGAHVVDEAPTLVPDGLHITVQLADQRLGGLAHLLDFPLRRHAHLLNLELSCRTYLLGFARGRLAEITRVALDCVAKLCRLALRGLTKLLCFARCRLAEFLGLVLGRLPCRPSVLHSGLAHLLRFLLCLLETLVCCRARAHGDLVGGLVRALQ